MAKNIQDDFENEEDLANQFESEQDLANEFEAQQSVQPKNLLEKIGSNISKTTTSVSPDLESGGQFIQDIGSDLIDTSRGIGQGLTIGSSDEIGGGISAGLEALYNRFNPTDAALREQGFKIEEPGLPELYRKNQQDIQKEFEKSSEQSPVLYGVGQVAGGMTSGGAIAGALGIGKAAPGAAKLADIARNQGKLKALGELGLRGGKTYGQALPLILAEGALSSQTGGLDTEENRAQLASDVAGSAMYGLPAVMGMQAVGEVAAPLAKAGFDKLKNSVKGIVEDSPLLRQMRVAHGYGTKGINPKSQTETLNTELGSTKLSGLDNERATSLVTEIQEADTRLGQAVGKSLEDADAVFVANNKFVDIDQDTRQALQQVKDLADKYPEITQNPKVQQIYEKISSANPDVLPSEAKDLVDYMNTYINKFKSATNKTPGEIGILSDLMKTEKQFRNNLKNQVPEYAAAAERFQQFRKLVPETIIPGSTPVGVTDQSYGAPTDLELFNPIKKLMQGTTRQGSSTGPIREAFYNTMQGMKTFEQQEAGRVASGAIKAGEEAFKRPVSAIETQIKKYSDDAVARNSMDALDPHTGVGNAMKQVVTGTGETGRSIALSSANLAGRLQSKIGTGVTKNPVAKMSRAIYNAPDGAISSLAGKLKNTSGLEKYGKQLEEALQSTNTHRKNQVLFTIMQNPSARAFVGDEAEEQQNQSGSYTPQE